MLTPVYSSAETFKRMKRRGENLDKLKILTRSLLEEGQLDPIHRDHKLIGHRQGRRECHIQSDWLLIYKAEVDRIVLNVQQTTLTCSKNNSAMASPSLLSPLAGKTYSIIAHYFNSHEIQKLIDKCIEQAASLRSM